MQRPLPEHRFEELCRRFSQLVMDEVVKAPYVKGSKEFLNDYYNVYQCFVATGTPQEEIDEIIKQREMIPYFQHGFHRLSHYVLYFIFKSIATGSDPLSDPLSLYTLSL